MQNALQHTATHCNTLQHTATHCNMYEWYMSVNAKRAWHDSFMGLKNCRVAVQLCVGRDPFMNGQFEDVAHVVEGRDLGLNDADCQKFTHVLVPIIELFVEWDQERASKI